MRTFIRWVFLVLTTLLFLGCASKYRSPGAEAEIGKSLALLENNAVSTMQVVEVDGIPRTFGYVPKYELTPGVHTIKVSLRLKMGDRGEPPTVTFSVDAGETYELLYESREINRKTLAWRPYVINKRTHEHVDFVVPPQSIPSIPRRTA